MIFQVYIHKKENYFSDFILKREIVLLKKMLFSFIKKDFTNVF